MLTGENGILRQAANAKESTEQVMLEEEVSLKLIEKQMEEELGRERELGYYLNQIQDANVEEVREDTWYVTRGNAEVTLYEEGEVVTGKVELWDGTSSEVPEINEFKWYIYNAKQLKFFADYVNTEVDDAGNKVLTEDQITLIEEKGYEESQLVISDDTVVYLMANIDMGARAENGSWETEQNETLNWTPVGISSKFTGTFEGNEHYIRGVYVLREDNFAGIFSQSDTIQNLTIKDSYIKSTAGCVGGIAGAVREGDIINCHNVNTTVQAGTYTAGGIVGQFSGTTIENCTNTGIITTKMSSSGISRAGGIVGGVTAGQKINNCENTGKVTATGTDVGGITGYIGNANSAEIVVENCKNTGTITTEQYDGGSYIGGIAGRILAGKQINNCENTGKITANGASVGGITGYIGNANSAEIVIENCKNTGTLSTEQASEGYSQIGGIVGFVNAGQKISDCENKGEVTAIGRSVGGIVGAVGSSATNYIVEKCTNTGTLTTEETEGGLSQIGGISGKIYDSQKINNCINEGNITAKGHDIGGIVGYIQPTDTTEEIAKISYCCNKGKIAGGNYAGGIVGRTNGFESIIEKSYNAEEVSGGDSIGGIVGILRESSSVQNCYNLATIKGELCVGGIIGTIGTGTINEEGSSINCYNIGKVIGGKFVGGIIGYKNISETIIINSYYLQGTATLDVGNGTGTEFVADENYLKTTFITNSNATETIWEIRERINKGYPVLIGMD